MTALKPMHTEGVAFAPRKSPRARCAKSNTFAQVLNQGVVYLVRRVESLAVCMQHMYNKCANFYAKDLCSTPGDNAFGVHGLLGIRGNPKDVDVFVMQEQSRRAVSSTTLRLLC